MIIFQQECPQKDILNYRCTYAMYCSMHMYSIVFIYYRVCTIRDSRRLALTFESILHPQVRDMIFSSVGARK